MQTLGLIGGIAPASTIEYYRLLVEGYRARLPDGSQPLILINSIDLQHFLSLVSGGDRQRLVQFLVGELAKLACGGAAFGLFASNTPHLVFEDVNAKSPIPLVSIVEAAGAAASTQGLTRVGLLGTRFTMEGGFYPSVFARYGVTITLPSADDRTYVHDHYLGELVHGVFSDGTRAGMLAVINRMRAEADIEAVVLGGTELPFLFRDGPAPDLPFLDTTKIHVAKVLDRLFSTGR